MEVTEGLAPPVRAFAGRGLTFSATSPCYECLFEILIVNSAQKNFNVRLYFISNLPDRR